MMRTLPLGEIEYNGLHCNLKIQQWTPNVVVLTIAGTDVGEFGEAPIAELNARVAGAEPAELFVDARDVCGVSIDVSCQWACWLGANKLRLQHVSMLTGSRFILVTADFVRRYADLQGIMKIYTDAAAFDDALAGSLGRSVG